MIRVAANLAWLVPGRVGGSEEYTVRLLSAVMSAAPSDVDLRLIGSPELFDAHPVLRAAECVPLHGPLSMRPWRIIAESTAGYRATGDADIVHHFGGRVPARRHGTDHRNNDLRSKDIPIKDIVTIHDLQPLQIPANFSWIKRHYLGLVLPRSVRSARMVIAPSDWVASTIIERFGVHPEKVRTVASTWDPDDTVDTSLADELGPGPVVLYPAVTHPHKRHELLLAAMGQVAEVRDDVTLVLTGGAGGAETAVGAAMARSPATVVRPGRVTAPCLRALYERADVVAFPSNYEGFGLPVLEAMRAGTPVVASARTALPEVVGDTGVLVDADDPGPWADAILATLAGGDDVADRTHRARIRAERWSPDAVAERLLDVWRSVA